MPAPTNKGGRRAGAWLAACIACTSSFEGLRQYAYRDPVGIPTICFGETKGVRMGDHKTADECEAMLADRLQEFSDGVDRCIHVPMSDKRRAGIVSFTYNVGVGTLCKSTLAKRLNAGDPGACEELDRFVKAKKAGVWITLPGLVRRRAAERELCEAA